MKNKFVIDYYVRGNIRNANTKARKDVNAILEDLGYDILKVGTKKELFTSLFLLSKIPLKSSVVVQYSIGRVITSFIVLCILKMKKIDLTLLVHDIESLRFRSKISWLESVNLNLASRIIAHTEAMKHVMLRSGIKAPIYILNLFDYLVEQVPQRIWNRQNIIFAGNLSKSIFLQKISMLPFESIHFYLYGIPMMQNRNKCIYKGSFMPDDLSLIELGWGLVWDGDSLDSCNGILGDYLRYNAPHKLSMYIAAGMPVIVWNESAEAKFVVDNNIGITVGSLYDVENEINRLSTYEFFVIKESVLLYSKKLRNGEMLKSILNFIEE